MRKALIASVAAAGMALAGPALACEQDLAEAQADLDVAADVDEMDRGHAAALLAEAEASLAAGDEAACMESVAEAQAIVGHEPPDPDTQ